MAQALVQILEEERTVDVPHELTRVQFLELSKLFVYQSFAAVCHNAQSQERASYLSM